MHDDQIIFAFDVEKSLEITVCFESIDANFLSNRVCCLALSGLHRRRARHELHLMAVNDSEVSSNYERVMYKLGNDGDDEKVFLELCILAWGRQLIT